MSLKKWQAKYLFGAGVVLPIAPFLLLQGQITRWKVGLLPAAAGAAAHAMIAQLAARQSPVRLLLNV